MLLDKLVHLGLGWPALIDVVEALGIREIVRLAGLAAVVEQKLPDVFPIRRAIVVAQDRETLLLALQACPEQRPAVAAALRFALRYRVDLSIDLRTDVHHTIERLAGPGAHVVSLRHSVRLESSFEMLHEVVILAGHPRRLLHGVCGYCVVRVVV